MMVVRENVRHLRKHCVDLAKADREARLHDLIEHELSCLPTLNGYENNNESDAGQEDHLLDF